MTWLLTFLTIGCVARFTRLITKDSLTEPFRNYVEARAEKAWHGDGHGAPGLKRGGRPWRLSTWWRAKYHGFWPWLDDLIHCPWCTSVHVSVAVAFVVVWYPTNRFVIAGLLATTASWVASNVQMHSERIADKP